VILPRHVGQVRFRLRTGGIQHQHLYQAQSASRLDTGSSVRARGCAADLLSRMTLDEKLAMVHGGGDFVEPLVRRLTQKDQLLSIVLAGRCG
jgi:hypothetical protein